MTRAVRRTGVRATAVGVAVVATGFLVPASASGGWDYAERGPETWRDHYPTCEGAAQSPVDIRRGSAVDADGTPVEGVTLDYARSSEVTVRHTGHTVQVDVPAGAGSLDAGGTAYELRQLHFHTPSEHRLSGVAQPVELHLVHAAPDGSLAVVGLLYRERAADAALHPVLSDLPGSPQDDARRVTLALDRVVPDDLDVYSYAGSLTTPPCSETVTWFVAKDVRPLSSGQVSGLEELFDGPEFPRGNARPVQPLGGRPVHATELETELETD